RVGVEPSAVGRAEIDCGGELALVGRHGRADLTTRTWTAVGCADAHVGPVADRGARAAAATGTRSGAVPPHDPARSAARARRVARSVRPDGATRYGPDAHGNCR